MALGRVAAKAATCPALPSAPRFPHRGGSSSRLTGTTARRAPTSHRCSRSEFRHHRPVEPRPVLARLRAAPIRRHPSELGPLTCFKPDTWERLRQAQDRRFPLPGTVPARHRTAGPRLERAQAFRTSAAPRPRSGG